MAIRNGPVARLSGVQVARGETRHGGRRDRRRVPLHTPHHSGPPPPPPPLKAEWQGGSGIRLNVVDQGELILTVPELHVRFRTPPPPLTAKGRTTRGLWNEASAVDLGGWTLVVQICSPLTLRRIRAPA
jgi:hypothetical protein